jgi:hypothetical protein
MKRTSLFCAIGTLACREVPGFSGLHLLRKTATDLVPFLDRRIQKSGGVFCLELSRARSVRKGKDACTKKSKIFWRNPSGNVATPS